VGIQAQEDRQTVKVFIAFVGVVLGAVAILTGAALAVLNLTAGLALCGAAAIGIMAAARHIERTDTLRELADLRAEVRYCRDWMCVPADDLRRRLHVVSNEYNEARNEIEQLKQDLGTARDRIHQLEAELAAEKSVRPVSPELQQLLDKRAARLAGQSEGAAEDAEWKRIQDVAGER
jgi:hypothetical protein